MEQSTFSNLANRKLCGNYLLSPSRVDDLWIQCDWKHRSRRHFQNVDVYLDSRCNLHSRDSVWRNPGHCFHSQLWTSSDPGSIHGASTRRSDVWWFQWKLRTRALFVENYNEEHCAASALWFCTSVLNLKIDISEDVGRFSAVESNHLRDSWDALDRWGAWIYGDSSSSSPFLVLFLFFSSPQALNIGKWIKR